MSKNRLSPSGTNGHAPAPPPASGSASAAEDTADFESQEPDGQKHEHEANALQLLLRQFGELSEYFKYYLSAKADSARLGVWNALFGMALAALAFVVVASLSVEATWLVVNGVAEGLGVLFGNRPWAGSLSTGLLLVAGLGGGIYGIVIRLKKTAREGTVAKYENRQARQQARYGHNVADRAAANDREPK